MGEQRWGCRAVAGPLFSNASHVRRIHLQLDSFPRKGSGQACAPPQQAQPPGAAGGLHLRGAGHDPSPGQQPRRGGQAAPKHYAEGPRHILRHRPRAAGSHGVHSQGRAVQGSFLRQSVPPPRALPRSGLRRAPPAKRMVYTSAAVPWRRLCGEGPQSGGGADFAPAKPPTVDTVPVHPSASHLATRIRNTQLPRVLNSAHGVSLNCLDAMSDRRWGSSPTRTLWSPTR